jgi:hypothetical protein
MAQQPLNLDLKEGTLSQSLGIKPEDDIPNDLLKAIIEAKIPEGEESIIIRNPTHEGFMPTYKGDPEIKVTKLMKKRASFAFTSKTRWGMGN